MNLSLSFTEIENLTRWKFKKIVKEKTTLAAFAYLLEQKNKPGRNGKQPKISCIEYEKLELQKYLHEENQSTKVSQFIFKARCKTLDIKMHKKWKYDDTTCTGCQVREESGEEILSCESFGKYDSNVKIPTYQWFYSQSVSAMIFCAKIMMERLKVRKHKIENG